MKRKNKILLSLGAISIVALPVTSLVACGTDNQYQGYVDKLHSNLKIYYSKPIPYPSQPGFSNTNVYLIDDSNLIYNGINNQNDIKLTILIPGFSYDDVPVHVSGSIQYEKYKLDLLSLRSWSENQKIDDKNFKGFILYQSPVSSTTIDYHSLPDGAKATITFTPIDTTTKFDPYTGRPENYNPPITTTFTIQIIYS